MEAISKKNKLLVLFLLISFGLLFLSKFLDALINHMPLFFADLLFMVGIAVMAVSFLVKNSGKVIFAIGLFIIAIVSFVNMFDSLAVATINIPGLEGVYAVLSVLYFLVVGVTGFLASTFFISSKKPVNKTAKLVSTIVRAGLFFIIFLMIAIADASYLGKDVAVSVMNCIFSMSIQGLLTVVIILNNTEAEQITE
jgi:hypothetical protein